MEGGGVLSVVKFSSLSQLSYLTLTILAESYLKQTKDRKRKKMKGYKQVQQFTPAKVISVFGHTQFIYLLQKIMYNL
jgi:hypothetical protein